MDHLKKRLLPHRSFRGKRTRELILASASPRRVQLLKEAGVRVRVIPSRVREKESTGRQDCPKKLVLYNAGIKAGSVSKKNPNHWVLGADTVVVWRGRIFGKPKDMNHAIEMLQILCGRTHRVLTGVCICLGGRVIRQFHVSTRVTFHPFTDRKIRAYLSRIHPLDKAGAYAAQVKRGSVIARVQGSFSNVIGLPMERVLKEFQRREMIFL